MTSLFDDGSRGATLSDDGRYRYDLWRRWADGPLMGWIMLNPSTGDAESDDHTIRKCIGFAQRAGASGIHIVNLFAFRTSKPAELAAADRAGIDVVGPANHHFLAGAAQDVFATRPLVAAWGAGPSGLYRRMVEQVATVVGLAGPRLQRLEPPPHLSIAAPHPARLAYTTRLVPYPEAAHAR